MPESAGLLQGIGVGAGGEGGGAGAGAEGLGAHTASTVYVQSHA